MADPFTKVGIVNRALDLIEHNRRLDDFGDGSPEADLAALHYDAARRIVLGRVRWHFAKSYIELDGVLAGELAPGTMDQVYQLPASVLKVLSLPNECRQIWRVAGATNRLYARVAPPLLVEVIVDVRDAARFEPGFVECLELLLAGRFAPRFSRSQNRSEILFKRYGQAIAMAEANEAAEGGDVYHDRRASADWRGLAGFPPGWGLWDQGNLY